MPHLIIEHSANVADHIDIGDLVGTLHDAALATGIAAIDALRTRAVSREHYAIGDREPNNAFVAVLARLGAGRSEADQRRFVDVLMEALDGALGDYRANTMLSVEYQEIDADRRVNRNHLRPLIATRVARAAHPTEET